MSKSLLQLAKRSATQETRKAFVEASKRIQAPIGVSLLSFELSAYILTAPNQFDHDYVLGVAKKATDARKDIFEGIGKGIERVVKTHS